ncbi:hypothetical protein [Streptomyces sp. H27-D2]|nr:hypothetical protein [Streptomyces sp. H27-D2]MEC4020605.1 hypothetical protein [Streptomyces sp. H27-D2]
MGSVPPALLLWTRLRPFRFSASVMDLADPAGRAEIADEKVCSARRC